MNGLKRATEKNLMIFSGRSNRQLAEEVAYQLGTNLVPTLSLIHISEPTRPY